MPRGRSWPGPCRPSPKNPDLHVVLVGDQAQIEPLLAAAGGTVATASSIFHCTPGSRHGGDAGRGALRKKPDNSISRCWQLLAERKVDAIVSAGNTGAMVAGGLRLRRFLKDVRRPGIAAIDAHAQGPCVLIDVGANVSPEAGASVPYGVMGSIFARHILQRDQPTIGLMNVGSEEAKGNDLAKETHALFNDGPLRDQFVGNIEGRDIHRGACDVVVTEGFRRQRHVKGLRGAVRIRHEDGRGRRSSKACRTTRSRPAGLAIADSQARLQRLRRRTAAGHRRHLHHLPRIERRARDQERLERRRQIRTNRV